MTLEKKFKEQKTSKTKDYFFPGLHATSKNVYLASFNSLATKYLCKVIFN